MLLPIILWFINGYLLVSHVLSGGTVSALLTATLAALIIFLIERSVIMSKGNNSIAAFRVSLGFVIALLGSISMDEVVFKNDIDNKVSEYKQEHIAKAVAQIDSSYKTLKDEQQSKVRLKNDEWQKALKEATGEADGTSGSGAAKVGQITKLKLSVASRHEKDYLVESTKLDTLQATIALKKQEADIKANASFKSDALLLRIKAMFELIGEDIYMMLIYILFTSFLFLIEFLVVIIKLCSSKSIDEELEDARISLLKSKTQKTLQNAIQYFEPQAADYRVQNARLALSSSKTNIFN